MLRKLLRAGRAEAHRHWIGNYGLRKTTVVSAVQCPRALARILAHPGHSFSCTRVHPIGVKLSNFSFADLNLDLDLDLDLDVDLGVYHPAWHELL
jgi:hypothetical protein